MVASISELKQQPDNVKKLTKVKTSSKLQVPKQSSGATNSDHKTSRSDFRSGNRTFNYYKIATYLLSLLWISTIILFVLLRPNSTIENEDEAIVQQAEPVAQPETPEPPKVVELNPVPNTQLNAHDLPLVVKEGLRGKTASEIVDIIFHKNPTQIANYYKDQKEVYTQLLISQNKNCFEGEICVDGSLVLVPAYKKE